MLPHRRGGVNRPSARQAGITRLLVQARASWHKHKAGAAGGAVLRAMMSRTRCQAQPDPDPAARRRGNHPCPAQQGQAVPRLRCPLHRERQRVAADGCPWLSDFLGGPRRSLAARTMTSSTQCSMRSTPCRWRRPYRLQLRRSHLGGIAVPPQPLDRAARELQVRRHRAFAARPSIRSDHGRHTR